MTDLVQWNNCEGCMRKRSLLSEQPPYMTVELQSSWAIRCTRITWSPAPHKNSKCETCLSSIIMSDHPVKILVQLLMITAANVWWDQTVFRLNLFVGRHLMIVISFKLVTLGLYTTRQLNAPLSEAFCVVHGLKFNRCVLWLCFNHDDDISRLPLNAITCDYHWKPF